MSSQKSNSASGSSPSSSIRTTSSFLSNNNSNSSSSGASLLASLESTHNNTSRENDDNGFDPLKLLTQKTQQQTAAKTENALDISNDAVSNVFMNDSGSGGNDGVDISNFMKFDDPNNPLLQAAKEPLAFDYNDSDSLLKELADLYSYTELGDFARNRLAFQQVFEQRSAGSSSSTTNWMQLDRSGQDTFVNNLLQQCAVSSNENYSNCMRALRAMLYLAQGSFSTDLPKIRDSVIEKRIRRNVCCLYRNGVWPFLLAVLQNEAEKTSSTVGLRANDAAAEQRQQVTPTFCFKDSINLRIIMNLMYTIVEVLRRPVVTVPEPTINTSTTTGAANNSTFNVTTDAGNASLSSSGVALPTFDVPVIAAGAASDGSETGAVVDGGSDSDDDAEIDADADEEEFSTFREQLVEDLRSKCMPRSRETLIVYLVKMLRQYIDGNHPHFAIKKILLLLWKCLLTSLGGFSDLRRLKEEKRMEKGLPPGLEDTLEVAKRMCSSSPPMTGVEMLAAEIGRRSTIPSGNLFAGGGMRLVPKQNDNNANKDGRKVMPQRRLTGIRDVFTQSDEIGNENSSKDADSSSSFAGGPAAKRRAMLRRTSEATRTYRSSADDDRDETDNSSSNDAGMKSAEKHTADENDDGFSKPTADANPIYLNLELIKTMEYVCGGNYEEIDTTTTENTSKSSVDVDNSSSSPAKNVFGDVSSAATNENNNNDGNTIGDEEAQHLLAQQQLLKNKRKRSFEEEVANEFNEKMPPSADDEIDEDDALLEQEEDDCETTAEPSNGDDIVSKDDDESRNVVVQQKKSRRSSEDEDSGHAATIRSSENLKMPSEFDSTVAIIPTKSTTDAVDAAADDDDRASQISSLASSVFSIREIADEKKLIERPLREISHLKRLRFTPKVRQQDVYRWLSRVRTKLSQQSQQQQPPSPASTQSGVNNGVAQQQTAQNGNSAPQNLSGGGMACIQRPIQFFSPPFPPYSRMAQHIGVNFAQWNDHLTAGLPQPAISSYNVLQRYLFYSLSEVYLQEEQDMTAYPYAVGMQLYPRPSSSFIEQLYVELLEEMPIFIVSLIRCIIAAGPSHKQQQTGGGGGSLNAQQQKQPGNSSAAQSAAGGEQINVVNDMMPSDIPPEIVEKLGIDVSRHKEIIMKACTFVLLLLMKHLKVNNTFQFEYMSILMVQGNGIALMMRFLNQNLIDYVEQINCVPHLEYPACVFGASRSRKSRKSPLSDPIDPIAVALREYPVEPMPNVENFMSDMPSDDSIPSAVAAFDAPRTSIGASTSANQSVLDLPAARRFSPRNLYTTINMLRIMQKLTKWKYARTLCLLHFKSQAKLKPLLRIRCPLLQVYVLKLLKCQVRYLGRQWRKSNMKIISAIYSKVRHRLSDEWAFGHVPMNEPELKLAIEDPKDEHALRAMVDGFNKRHYPNIKPRMPMTASPANQQSNDNKNIESTSGADLGANVWDMPPPWEITDKLASTAAASMGNHPESNGSAQHLDIETLIFGNNVANSDGNDGATMDSQIGVGDDAWLAERFQTSLDMWVEEEVMKKSYNWEEMVVQEADGIVGSSLA